MTNEADMIYRSMIVRQLGAWVVELLPECDELMIDERTSLTQFAGFDSIAIVQLLTRAENVFDVDLADDEQTIKRMDTIGSLADSIVQLRCGPK